MSEIYFDPNNFIVFSAETREILMKYTAPVYSGFTTEWTVAGDAAARTISLPFTDSGTYNCTIDWGDGSALSTITTYDDSDNTHTYAADGTYKVEVVGEAPGWSFFTVNTHKDKITKVLYWGDSAKFGGFSYLTRGFPSCTNLTSIGTGKIIAKDDLTSLEEMFVFDNITNIPTGFLDNCINVTNMAFVFGYTDISTIPTDLFRYNTGVTNFQGVFEGCTNITNSGVPADLFRYNTEVTSMNGVLRATSITTAPPDLFKYNTKVENFIRVFQDTPLTGITDSTYFQHSTGATIDFSFSFFQCSSLETIPNGLLDNNGLYFEYTFYGCTKLQINRYTFITTPGETATRFLNQSPNFKYCFQRSSFTGTQGTAPNLWDYDYGTGTPQTTDCFDGAGNDGTSISNYANIPAGWK